MAFPVKTSDTQRAIIAQLLETDPEILQESRALVLQAIRDLRNLQVRGDPAIRAQLAKALASPITQFIFESKTDDGDSSLRAEMHEMMEEIRGGLMDREPEPAPRPPTPLVPKSR